MISLLKFYINHFQATLSHDIVSCFHDLSRKFGIALVHEEKRNGFLSKEAKIMLAAHDEVLNIFLYSECNCN